MIRKIANVLYYINYFFLVLVFFIEIDNGQSVLSLKWFRWVLSIYLFVLLIFLAFVSKDEKNKR